jgi:predicted RNase H-like HicB family nuclease
VFDVCYTEGMTLKAIIHTAEEGGFWAEVPALPGCVTQGETEEEVKANLREAITGWLEAGEAGEIDVDSHVLEVAV